MSPEQHTHRTPPGSHRARSAASRAAGLLLLLSALLSAAVPAVAQAPFAPPSGASVLRASYEGRVVGEEAVFTLRIDARRMGDSWGEVPFPAGEYRIDSWTCEPAGAVRMLDSGSTVKFLLQGDGDVRIDVRLTAPVARSERRATVEIPLIPAAAAVVEFEADGRDLVFLASPDAPQEILGEARNRVRVAPAPGSSLNLEWRPRDGQADAGATYRVEDRTLFQVGAGVVEALGRYRIVVERGGLDQIAFRLASQAAVLAVEGDAVARWYVENRDQDRLLHVRFVPRITRETVLRVRHDAPIDGLPGTFVLEPPAVEGAREQAGTIALAADAELATREEGTRAAERIETAAVQSQFEGLAQTVRAGWRYARLPAAVTLGVERKTPRLRVSSESSVMIEKDTLVLRTVAAITIDEIGASALRFRRPADLEILTVTGKAVRDWRASGDLLEVNLLRRTLGTVALQVEAAAALPGRGEVVLPRLDLLDTVESTDVIGVASRGETAVETAATAGAAQVNPKELPAWLQQVGSRLAYRLRERKGEIKVAVSPLAPETRVEVFTLYRVESDRISGLHRIAADVSRAPVFAVDLTLPPGQEPVKVSGAHVRDWTFRDADRTLRIDLKAGRTGALALAVETESRVDTTKAASPLGGLVWAGAKEQRGWAAFAAAGEIEVTAAGTDQVGEIPIGQLPGELRATNPVLAYRCAGATWSVRVAAKPLTPRIQARSTTVAEIRRGLVTALCVADLEVERAGIRRLRVTLPTGALNSRVDAEDLQGRRFEDGAWELTFAGSRKGAVRITMGYEMAVPDDDPQVRVSPPEIAGVERMEGVLLVARDQSGAEVELVRGQGTTALDRQELPEEFRDASLAYTHMLRFARTPAQAVFRVTTHQRGQVEAAQMGMCDLHTIVQPDGDALTYLNARLTNTDKQYLELAFPDTATVWGGYVDGEPVKPSLGEGGKIRFPLPRATAGRIQCDVSVVWTQKVGALGLAARPSFRAPESDIKMEAVRWAVYLPGGYHMLDAEGSLRLAAVEPGMEAPRLFERMGRILKEAVPPWLITALAWILGIGLAVGTLAGACAFLLWLRDALRAYEIHPLIRFGAIAALVVAVAAGLVVTVGKRSARLFKAASMSLDEGAPSQSRAADRINTEFTLRDMGEQDIAASSGYAAPGAAAPEPASGPAQREHRRNLRGADQKNREKELADDGRSASEEATIGNYRQQRKGDRAAADKPQQIADEPMDHNETADQEEFAEAGRDYQNVRGNIADARLKDLERKAEERRPREADRYDDGQLAQAGDKLERALKGKKSAPAPAADPDLEMEKQAAAKGGAAPAGETSAGGMQPPSTDEGRFAGGKSANTPSPRPSKQPGRASELASRTESPLPSDPESPPTPDVKTPPATNLGLLHAQSTLQAADAIPFRRVERGLCEAALPIAVSFPVAGTRKVQFQEMSLAGGDARLDVWCVAAGTSLAIQLGTVGLLGVGLIALGWAWPRAGALVAGVALAAVAFASSGADAPLAPYLSVAAWSSGASLLLLSAKAIAAKVFPR